MHGIVCRVRLLDTDAWHCVSSEATRQMHGIVCRVRLLDTDAWHCASSEATRHRCMALCVE